MYKRLILSAVLLALGAMAIVFPTSAYAINPEDQSTWPFDVNQAGVYYVFYHNSSAGQASTCYINGTNWGSCYYLFQYSEPMCDISTVCTLYSNTGWSNGNELRMNMAFAGSTNLVGNWYYKQTTDEWISGTGGQASYNNNVIDSRYPFYQSVWSNMGGWVYNPEGSSYAVKTGYGLDTPILPAQPIIGSGNQSCNVQALFTDQNPDDNGIFEAWWSFKLWFWNTFSPVCFFDETSFNSVNDALELRAPFAYVYAVFDGMDFDTITEDENVADIIFPLTESLGIAGNSYTWVAPDLLHDILSSIKTVLGVVLWLGFIIYLWRLPSRVITK